MDVTRSRGTTNSNKRGNTTQRRRRREWLVEVFRADVDVQETEWPGLVGPVPLGEGMPACRCYRCGDLLTVDTVSVDRIVPGAEGGKYEIGNIRPACLRCQELTGAQLGIARRAEISAQDTDYKIIKRTRHPGTFQAVLRAQVQTETGSHWRQVFGCEHKHRTESSALRCARTARKAHA